MERDHRAGHGHSCSSSIDSSNHYPQAILHSAAASSSSSSSSSSSLAVQNKISKRDLSTDLKLGLSISPSTTSNNSTNLDVSRTSSQQREPRVDWPPIKSLLRSTLAVNYHHHHQQRQRRRHNDSLFVKVYMEGVPIGRKLDLFAHDGYIALITALRHMFKTPILCPDDTDRVHNITSDHHKHHVLTYEDKDGDWMMVGDVPWEMFLTTVRRLKITRADRC